MKKLITKENYDFLLYGIVSSVKAYQLAWEMNKKLDVKLVRQEDYLVHFKDRRSGSFVRYTNKNNNFGIHFFQNKSLENSFSHLLPEHTHFDFIMKIESAFAPIFKESFLKQLANFSHIEYISAISPRIIKSRNNFLE